MSQPEYETIELPGAGEIRARKGTSTLELAGAAKHWYDRYQTARIDGIVAGASYVVMGELVAAAIYYVIRSL